MLKLAGYYEVKNIPKYANTHGPHKGVIPHIHKKINKPAPSKRLAFSPHPTFQPTPHNLRFTIQYPARHSNPGFFKKSRDSSTALRSTQSWRTTRSTPSMRPRICCTSERVPTGGVSMMI